MFELFFPHLFSLLALLGIIELFSITFASQYGKCCTHENKGSRFVQPISITAPQNAGGIWAMLLPPVNLVGTHQSFSKILG